MSSLRFGFSNSCFDAKEKREIGDVGMILRFRSMLGIAMVVLHVDGLKDFIQMRYELEKNIYDQI